MATNPIRKNSLELLLGWSEEAPAKTRVPSERARAVAVNRTANLLELLKHFSNAKAFHKATRVSMSLLSIMQRGGAESMSSQSMGESVARRIEVSLQLPAYWMDRKNVPEGSLPQVSVGDLPPALVDDAMYTQRIDNLHLLLRHFGFARELSRHCGIRGEHISSIKGWRPGNTDKTYRRMGEWVARSFELALDLPEYWMDKPNNGNVPELAPRPGLSPAGTDGAENISDDIAAPPENRSCGSGSPGIARGAAYGHCPGLLFFVNAADASLELPELS